MTVTEATRNEYVLTEYSENFAKTGVSSEQISVLVQDEAESKEAAWHRIIDKLIDWSKTPRRVDEDDWESPSLEAINKSYELVRLLRGNDRNVPSQVVPSGEGGIVFENEGDPITESIEIDCDGDVEYCCFDNCRLVERRVFEIY